MTRLFAGTPFDIPPTCDRCGASPDDCRCPPEPEKPSWIAAEKQTAKLRVDSRKHQRKMTVVAGLSPTESDLSALLTVLKNACGAGGTVKDQAIEIQGDHLTRVSETLKKIGYRVR